MIAANVAKQLPQQALTKGVIYPVVKKVAGYLGASMTKKFFASGVAKAIPVVDAILSGGLTLGTFLPMSKRLQHHLASLELTKLGHRPEKAAANSPEGTVTSTLNKTRESESLVSAISPDIANRPKTNT